ncbi:MAG: hypothetical protein RL325_1368 [Planctomycetota bacterium]|jgi:prepilin-type N-terminal cleavage/methylation domain-containing protein
MRTHRHDPVAVARGLTLVEVLVATVILAVAGLAALELLSRTDAASLHARRQALAAVEAERLLESAAADVRVDRPGARSEEFEPGVAAEALSGCTARVRETRGELSVGDPAGGTQRLPVVRLEAEVRDPSGASLVSLERIVPVGGAGGAR